MGRHSVSRGRFVPGETMLRDTEYVNGVRYKVGLHGWAFMLVNGRWQRSHNAEAIKALGARADVSREISVGNANKYVDASVFHSVGVGRGFAS